MNSGCARVESGTVCARDYSVALFPRGGRSVGRGLSLRRIHVSSSLLPHRNRTALPSFTCACSNVIPHPTRFYCEPSSQLRCVDKSRCLRACLPRTSRKFYSARSCPRARVYFRTVSCLGPAKFGGLRLARRCRGRQSAPRRQARDGRLATAGSRQCRITELPTARAARFRAAQPQPQPQQWFV